MTGYNSFGRGNVIGMVKALADANTPIFPVSGAPISGTSGTFAGLAGPGAVDLDTSIGMAWINQGTLASPIWTTLGVGSISAEFDVTGGDNGNVGLTTLTPNLPAGTIITGGIVDVTETFTSITDNALIGIGVQTTNVVADIAINDASNPWDFGLHNVIPDPSSPATTGFKVASGDFPLVAVIAAENLTAGRMNILLSLFVSN